MTDLPIENELIDGELYVGPYMNPGFYMKDRVPLDALKTKWTRYAPVAVYDPNAPRVPAEPRGLGAVVKDARGRIWVHSDLHDIPQQWFSYIRHPAAYWTSWADMPQPAEILSVGWSE